VTTGQATSEIRVQKTLKKETSGTKHNGRSIRRENTCKNIKRSNKTNWLWVIKSSKKTHTIKVVKTVVYQNR